MTVDSFKFLPRILAAYYLAIEQEPLLPIPWTPLSQPLAECRFGLVTSGGLYELGKDLPFNLERERQQPTWGDPTYRAISVGTRREGIGASHLHIDTRDVLEDVNILLPLDRFQDLADTGRIGGQAPYAYSFMGYQGFPPDTKAWELTYGPRVARLFKDAEVDCVLLTPA